MSSTSAPTGGDILARRNDANWSKQSLPDIKDVLIVEDEAFDADRLQATLSIILGRDIEIRRAHTLAVALDRVLEAVPDIVFLDDYLKPNDNAAQTIPLVRRAGYEGPIVIVSGEVDRRRAAELKALGAAHTLHKEDVDSGSVTEALNAAFGSWLQIKHSGERANDRADG